MHLPGLHAGGLQPVDKGVGVLANLADAIRPRQGGRVQDDACTPHTQVLNIRQASFTAHKAQGLHRQSREHALEQQLQEIVAMAAVELHTTLHYTKYIISQALSLPLNHRDD